MCIYTVCMLSVGLILIEMLFCIVKLCTYTMNMTLFEFSSILILLPSIEIAITTLHPDFNWKSISFQIHKVNWKFRGIFNLLLSHYRRKWLRRACLSQHNHLSAVVLQVYRLFLKGTLTFSELHLFIQIKSEDQYQFHLIHFCLNLFKFSF